MDIYDMLIEDGYSDDEAIEIIALVEFEGRSLDSVMQSMF